MENEEKAFSRFLKTGERFEKGRGDPFRNQDGESGMNPDPLNKREAFYIIEKGV